MCKEEFNCKQTLLCEETFFFHLTSGFATGIKMEKQRFEATVEEKPVDN